MDLLLSPPPLALFVRLLQVVSLGEACTGKSCLIKRYCEKKFVSKYISTIGVDFGVRSVRHSGTELKVNLWDLAGAGDLFDVRKEFHANAQGVMLVYDVHDAASFSALPRWMEEHRSQGGAPLVVVLCANKCDAPEAGSVGSAAPPPRRAVSEAEGRAYAASNGFVYMETSAKSGQNVDQLFEAIFKGIAEKTPWG